MSKLLVVLGATGLQGGSVVASYLHKPEWGIRAIKRDPSKPTVKALVDQSVEVVSADLNGVDSLSAAFKGANMIFAHAYRAAGSHKNKQDVLITP